MHDSPKSPNAGNGSHRHDSQHGTYRVPKCCGMPMAYSGQSGFYCLKCGSRG
jgi:hypothetical protein